MKSIILLFFLSSYIIGQSQEIYIAGMTLKLGMDRSEIIKIYENTAYKLDFGNKDSVDCIIYDWEKKYLGSLSFDEDNRLSFIQKEWLLNSKNDEFSAMLYLFHALTNIKSKYEFIIVEIITEEVNEPNLYLSNKAIEFNFDINRKLKIIIHQSNIQISEYLQKN